MVTVAQRAADRIWIGSSWLQGMIDCAAWTGAILVTSVVEVDNGLSPPEIWVLIPLVCALQILIGATFGLYRARYIYGSFAEIGLMAIVTLSAGIALVPMALPALAVTAALTAIVVMAGMRYGVRFIRDSVARPRVGEPVVIIGAGDAGRSLIRQMLDDAESAYLPVGIIDDSPGKRHLRVCGVPVIGATSDLAAAAARQGARGAIVAIAGTDATFLRRCRDKLDGSGIWLRTIPSLSEFIHRGLGIDDIRDLNVEDLIGRCPVSIDGVEVARIIAGRTVLVTGAGGSIGSELCRQLSALGPDRLIMLDRDETALHGVELSITGSALLTSPDTVLADIRDGATLEQIFADRRPQIVFHAAALKHLPMLERFPLEGWKTNVHGTLNVLTAARRAGVGTFINVSTDKAAAPSSELGRSKRIGERLVAGFAHSEPDTYLSVRFGNVLGSRGSVLLSFQEQLRNGGPLTITDPEVSRYFMTIPEACQLVLQAAVVGDSGSVLVLDMGEPVRILDIAHNLMRLTHRHAEITYTGLRPGEKLHEELFDMEESIGVRVRDKISSVQVPKLFEAQLPAPSADAVQVRDFSLAACDPASQPPPLETAAVVGKVPDHAG